MSVLRVIRAGLCTTVQDLGRSGLREYGVPLTGAMDRLSHELANRLVGNPATAATLEMTLTGDELEWPDGGLIAVTGAEMRPMISVGEQTEVMLPMNRPVMIPAGARIRFQTPQRGCRSYIAVAGGIDVPLVMDSRATYLRALVGGFHGRALQAGDVLPIGASAELAELNERTLIVGEIFTSTPWFVRPLDLPTANCVTLRVLTGSHFSHLALDSQRDLWNAAFQISPQSDRMGYRLSGANLRIQNPEELLSEGTAVGTLQLPPDGAPILLMADSAPTGGYRRIAQVITADLPVAAQLRPGQMVSFMETTLTEAQRLARQQRDALNRALIMASLL
jgi:antagonist of KipI